jgi:hypothetical protein
LISGNLSSSPSTSAFTWSSYTIGGVPDDSRFNIICQGPR